MADFDAFFGEKRKIGFTTGIDTELDIGEVVSLSKKSIKVFRISGWTDIRPSTHQRPLDGRTFSTNAAE